MTVADSRIDELRRRLERDPASRLFAQLAEEHRKAGDHGEAIRVARAGLAVHPAYPSARLTLGRALLDSGDSAGARTELEAALRDAPDNILASRFLGQALEALGEHGLALFQLEKTLKMAPGDRQLEAQVAALQARVAAPAAARVAPPPVPTPAAAEAAGGERLPATILIYNREEHGGRRPGAPAPAAPPVAPPRPEPPLPPPRPAAPPAPVEVAPAARPQAADTVPPEVDSTTPPLPASALAVEETFFDHEGAIELAPEEPGPSAAARAWAEHAAAEAPAAGAREEPAPFSSSTLAELYLRQGLVDRAVEVYRQVLAGEPGNERARSRLAELESAKPVDPRAARRLALEQTIAGLETLLGALRARRPA